MHSRYCMHTGRIGICLYVESLVGLAIGRVPPIATVMVTPRPNEDCIVKSGALLHACASSAHGWILPDGHYPHGVFGTCVFGYICEFVLISTIDTDTGNTIAIPATHTPTLWLSMCICSRLCRGVRAIRPTNSVASTSQTVNQSIADLDTKWNLRFHYIRVFTPTPKAANEIGSEEKSHSPPVLIWGSSTCSNRAPNI